MLEFDQRKRKKPHPEILWQQRAIREGRGVGHGSTYRPFIQVRRQDFPSHGLSQVLRNPLIDREHHFLSSLEFKVALRLLNLGVIDLREQYPLRLGDDDADFSRDTVFPSGTISLAECIGIRHPHITREAPRILTTDMVVTDETGRHYAIFVRHTKDLPTHGSRQAELLELQRKYWTERSVPLAVITEQEIDPTLTAILIWAQDGLFHPQGGATAQFLKFLKGFSGMETLKEILSQWHEGLPAALARFKTSIFIGLIVVNMQQRVFSSLEQPWEFRVTDPALRAQNLHSFLLKREASHA